MHPCKGKRPLAERRQLDGEISLQISKKSRQKYQNLILGMPILKMDDKKWLVYLVRCSDNSLYCGITNDLNSRLVEHNTGKGAKYTRSRRPVEAVGVSPEMTKSEALRLEHKIKRSPADKKLSELTSKENAMTLKQDLKALQKEMKAFEKKMEKLTIAIAKSEKSTSAKKSRAKSVKPKTAKKTPAQKVPASKSHP